MGATRGAAWTTQEEYEAMYGTQAEQAAKQSSAGVAFCDGPWRLCRWGLDGKIVLPNSVRSTSMERDRLRDEEYARTEILWSYEKFTRQDGEVRLR